MADTVFGVMVLGFAVVLVVGAVAVLGMWIATIRAAGEVLGSARPAPPPLPPPGRRYDPPRIPIQEPRPPVAADLDAEGVGVPLRRRVREVVAGEALPGSPPPKRIGAARRRQGGVGTARGFPPNRRPRGFPVLRGAATLSSAISGSR